MRIGIASDHRGYNLKEQIKEKMKDCEIIDFGTNSTESIDYTDYAFPLSEAVRDQKVDYGVAICGSGIGMSIACNKVKGVRCARVVSKEEAKVTRIDNNSNVVAFGESIPLEEAIEIVETFVTTPFSTEERHHRRVNKIIAYEESH